MEKFIHSVSSQILESCKSQIVRGKLIMMIRLILPLQFFHSFVCFMLCFMLLYVSFMLKINLLKKIL